MENGQQGSDLGLPRTSCAPGESHDPLPSGQVPQVHAPNTEPPGQGLCNEPARGFRALTQKTLGMTSALSAYWSHVPPYVGACGESAHFAKESYFLPSPNVAVTVCTLGPVLVARGLVWGHEG